MDTKILDAKTYNEMAKKFTLLDDIFMTKVFENNTRLTAFVLKIILNRELKVTSVKIQDDITNLHGHSVCLDVHAISADGKHFNIEVQKENKGAIPRRARYNSSILDANILPAGKDYRFLPETYIIFITKRDVLKLGEPIYFIERMIVGKDKLFDDGSHIVYVNNKIKDDTPLGRLMHDFDCKNPDKMFYEIIADKVSEHKIFERSGYKVASVIEKWLNEKISEKADEKARELAEQMRRELAEQMRRETAEKTIEFAKNLIAESGLSLEKIASICKLPLEQVQALAAAK